MADEDEVTEVEVLVLVNPDNETWDILGDSAGVYDDNGCDPDGFAWYAPVADIDEDKVAAIVGRGKGRVTTAVEVEYDGDHRDMHPKFGALWCGYSSRRLAYVRKEAYTMEEIKVKAKEEEITREFKQATSIRLSRASLEIIDRMHEAMPWLASGARKGNVSLAVAIALQAWADQND